MTLRRFPSMQARLLALVLGMVVCVWLAAAAFTWFDARRELGELLDGHLAQAASLLVAQQSVPNDDDEVVDAPSLHKYAPRVAFQVFHEGQLVIRSANAGEQPMSTLSKGFETIRLADGEEWRVFATRGAKHDVLVYVAERTDARASILWAVLRSVLLPLCFALPLLALACWWAVRQGLAPLRLLSMVLRQRQPQVLEPVVLPDMPTEMQPVVQALNALFARIDRVVEFERRFTADAAHELRTPIAAIRAQAQVALGAGGDTAQLQHALQATLAGCDRATRLVEQLLTLARLEAAPTASLCHVDLGAVVRSVAADLAPAALQRQQVLELDAEAETPVAGDGLLLGVLVRNLIDNALRYSPAGAAIHLAVQPQDGEVRLLVEDSGPGMSQADAIRLGERFFRVLGQDQPGSGLGWSIVQRIADVSGAQIHVGRSEALGGLAVTVCWPLAGF